MGSNNNGGRSPSIHPIHHHHCGGAHHHHHHHVFYVSPQCPLHRPLLQPRNHSPSCSFPSTQNIEPQLTHLHTHPNQILNDAKNLGRKFDDDDRLLTLSAASMDARMVENEIEEEEDEEEGDPMFVLTDEWRDFFAKSEAKRRLAKKQARKGKK